MTSYDYDALLTEDGQITEKYRRYRDIIAKYREIPEITFTTEIKRKAYGTLPVKEKVSLFSMLDDISAPVESSFPQSMEKLGQNYGYILYHSTLDTEEKLEKLRLWEANDRANIFVDQKPVTTLYDLELLKEKELDVTFERGADFDILMENMGPASYVKDLFESIGIINAKDKAARFYAAMYFYYSIYDGAADKEKVKVEFVSAIKSLVQELK